MSFRLFLIGVPVFLVFAVSVLVATREKGAMASAQLAGAGCFVVVIFAHIAEAFGFLPSMKSTLCSRVDEIRTFPLHLPRSSPIYFRTLSILRSQGYREPTIARFGNSV